MAMTLARSPRRPVSLCLVRVTPQPIDELIAHARGEAPNECCGMIAGDDGRLTSYSLAANEFASPMRFADRFRRPDPDH